MNTDDLEIGLICISEVPFLRTENRMVPIDEIEQVKRGYSKKNGLLVVLIYLCTTVKPVRFTGVEAERVRETISESSFRHD